MHYKEVCKCMCGVSSVEGMRVDSSLQMTANLHLFFQSRFSMIV